MKVLVKNGNVDQALRTLKRRLTDDGRLKDVRDKEFYEKPSWKRTRKRQAAVLRERKRSDKE